MEERDRAELSAGRAGTTDPLVDASTCLALLQGAFQHAATGLAVVNREFRYVQCNDALASMHGLPAGDHIGRLVRDVVPGLWTTLEPVYCRVMSGERVADQEISGSVSPEAGEVRHLLCGFAPLELDGEIVGISVAVTDVTERHRYREALRVRSDLYAMLARTNRAVSERRSANELFADVCRIAVETGHFCFAWIGMPHGDRMRMQASAGDDKGYQAGTVITLDETDRRSHGPTGRALTTGESFVVNDFMSSPMTAPWHEAARRAGFAASAAFPLKERGRTAAVLMLYSECKDFFTPELVAALGEITPSVSFALDSMAHERDQQRDEVELRLRDRAIRALSQGICITDARADNAIIYVSPGFERLTGYSAVEAIGQNVRMLQGRDANADAAAVFHEAITEGRGCTVELLNHRKDGAQWWNEVTISPVIDERGTLTHFVGVLSDVSERRRLEHQVRQAQKMEAVGQLASGVAHDFNNLLTVILGYSGQMLSELAADDEHREPVHEIWSAGQRASALTRRLLAFSRQEIIAPKILNLNAVMRDSENLLRRLIGADIQLSTNLDAQLWPVKADPGHMEQVLLNLAVNARDAMPSGGTLTLSTTNVTSYDGLGAHPAGDFVVLEVTDTGTGMDARTRERMFEPFFTTKPAGKGTGLGLATVRGIIDQQKGFLAVDSVVGSGTTFRVYLPREYGAHADANASLRTEEMARGSETILFVEDDDAVRTLGLQILRGCGYTVLEAGDGKEAMNVTRTYSGIIHLLISDVVLPHLGGRLLADGITSLRADCKVLFVSGYTDDSVLRHGVVESEVAFLQKPYAPMALSQKVRSVLDGGN